MQPHDPPTTRSPYKLLSYKVSLAPCRQACSLQEGMDVAAVMGLDRLRVLLEEAASLDDALVWVANSRIEMGRVPGEPVFHIDLIRECLVPAVRSAARRAGEASGDQGCGSGGPADLSPERLPLAPHAEVPGGGEPRSTQDGDASSDAGLRSAPRSLAGHVLPPHPEMPRAAGPRRTQNAGAGVEAGQKPAPRHEDGDGSCSRPGSQVGDGRACRSPRGTAPKGRRHEGGLGFTPDREAPRPVFDDGIAGGRRTGRFALVLEGTLYPARSQKELLVVALRRIERERPGTMERLSADKGRTKRPVARSREQLYRDAHLARHAERIDADWWAATNNSFPEVEKVIRRAAFHAGLHVEIRRSP